MLTYFRLLSASPGARRLVFFLSLLGLSDSQAGVLFFCTLDAVEGVMMCDQWIECAAVFTTTGCGVGVQHAPWWMWWQLRLLQVRCCVNVCKCWRWHKLPHKITSEIKLCNGPFTPAATLSFSTKPTLFLPLDKRPDSFFKTAGLKSGKGSNPQNNTFDG